MKARRLVKAAGVLLLSALVALAAVLGLFGRQNPIRAERDSARVEADLQTAAGVLVASARFSSDGDAVRVRLQAKGLTPGFHGFHIHEVGMCDGSTATPFSSAGGHLGETENGRGGSAHSNHGGDMPSLYINADGSGTLSFRTDRFTLADLIAENGRAVMIHADADNFANIPTRYAPAPDAVTLATGDSGGRIACGVVRQREG